MILKYDSYENIARIVKQYNKKIVVYGAGMIGQIIIPYIISEYKLEDYLLFYIDGDRKKQEQIITISGRTYSIKTSEILKNLPTETIILITNSNFFPIVEMMDQINELNRTEGYIIPVIQAIDAHKEKSHYDTRVTESQIIPKKIHYCWFSRNQIPDYLIKCIDSWHKFCPDYEIVRWDEDNYDVNKNTYMRQAYEAKKWGFVPDVARLDILYEHGGIYLDTDVELIKNLDDLLYQPVFLGVEKWGSVNVGGCCGAVPHHPIIKQLLDFRINEKFYMNDGGLNQTTCGYYETKPLQKIGMKPNNTIQRIGDITIFSSDFFHPYDYMSGKTYVTENTYSIHHFNGGWLDEKNICERKQTMELYHKMLKRMQVKVNE